MGEKPIGGWLTDQVALITGGASGLGKEIARRYLAEGSAVTLVDRDEQRLQDTAIELGGDRVHYAVADVREPGPLQDAVAQTVARFGKLSILVPNAGIWDFNRAVTRLSGEQLAAACDEVFAVNVKGYLLTVQAAWRELVASRGNVIMTLSNASFHSSGGGPVYTASKFAGRGLVTQLAYELAPKVRVNGVAVGAMRTDLRGPSSIGLEERSIEQSFAKQQNAGENPYIPLHDAPVDPAELTGPYVFLASQPNSSTITGAVIPADGGIAVRGFRSAAGGDEL